MTGILRWDVIFKELRIDGLWREDLLLEYRVRDAITKCVLKKKITYTIPDLRTNHHKYREMTCSEQAEKWPL